MTSGGDTMKGINRVAEQAIVSVTEKLVSKNVNSACIWCFYQDKLPEKCKRLKK